MIPLIMKTIIMIKIITITIIIISHPHHRNALQQRLPGACRNDEARRRQGRFSHKVDDESAGRSLFTQGCWASISDNTYFIQMYMEYAWVNSSPEKCRE